jgi:hypothetical protein
VIDGEMHMGTDSGNTTAGRRLAVLAVGALMLVAPATASAGRLIATGHDTDHHCGRVDAEVRHRQCHFFQVALEYLRAGAPDPAKPVLVLDRGQLDVVTSLDRIYGPGVVPRVVLDPRSAEFAQAAITTDLYSAIVVASSRGDKADPTPQDLNEIDSAPDSEAINRRAADLRAFFDAGGGIFVNSGSTHGDSAGDPYYAFLPVTVQGANATPPFQLTDVGRGLGLVEDDVTCCQTHNVFDPPSPESALQPIDVDAGGKIASVVASTQKFSAIEEPPVTQAVVQETAKDLPPSTASDKCSWVTSVKLRLRRPRKVRFSSATVYVNNRRVKRLKGAAITRPIKVRLPRVGANRVKVTIITTGKRKITIRRTYRRCG